MKNKKSMIVLITLIVVIGICITAICIINKSKKNKVQDRYKEIRESAKKAVDWYIGASQPYCVIGDKKEKKKYSHSNSSFFINNGYIKKDELLDVDGVNYCDIYVVVYRYIDESISLEAYKNDCEINYKIYLKCNDYKDKGYIDWGN